MNDAPQWLTSDEVCTRLRVSKRTLNTYIRKGALPVHRIRFSRLLRFRSEDVDAMIEPVPQVVTVMKLRTDKGIGTNSGAA